MRQTIRKSLASLVAVVGFAAVAQANVFSSWTLRATDAAGYEYTGYDQRATEMVGHVFKGTFDADSLNGITIMKLYGGNSNDIFLETTDAGNVRIRVVQTNSGSSRATYTSEASSVALTKGEHVFAMLLRRGPGQGGHEISIIVHMDGAELVSLGDGTIAFAGNPINRVIYGSTAAPRNLVTGYTSNDATAVASDATTMAEIDAKAAEIFPAYTEHAATVSANVRWSEIAWTPPVENPGLSHLTLTVENDAVITLDQAPTFDTLVVTGPMTIDTSALDGNELAKNAAAGAPYSHWLLYGKVVGTVNVTDIPSVPPDYRVQLECLPAVGVRLIVTAPAAAQFGAVSLNLNRGNALSGSGNHGLHPVAREKWGELRVGNSAAATVDGLTFTLSSAVSDYGLNNTPPDMIQKEYMDDDNSASMRSIAVRGMSAKGYAKYRAIVYFSTDTANTCFSPMAVTAAGETTYYAGPTSQSTAGGVTVKGRNAGWGETGGNHTANPLAEGVNALVTDVMTEDSISLGFVRAGGRATPCAVQIVKVGNIVESHSYTTTVDRATSFSEAVWTPTPSGAFTAGDTITLVCTESATFTFDEDLAVGTLAVESAAGKLLTIKRNGDISATVGALDFSGAADGIGWDARDGYTACDVLKNYLQDAETKVTFFGDGENGATLTYGSAERKAFKSHLVFEGGTHGFTYGGGQDGKFAVNATEENPTILVRADTALDFFGHDIGGYQGASSRDAVVRVADGGKLYMKQATGTVYYHQGLTLEPGADSAAELYVDMPADQFRLQGGTNEATAQIQVPASEGGRAYIKPVDATRDSIRLHHDATIGLAVSVGEGSTLDIQTKLTTENATTAYEVRKCGTGTLRLTGDLSGFKGAFTVAAGTLDISPTAIYNASTVMTVAEGSTLKLDFGTGTNILTRAKYVNGGEIEITGGTAIVPSDFGSTVTSSGAGRIVTGYNVGINDLGKFAIPAGKSWDELVVFNNAGQPLEITDHDENYVYFEWQITDGACWWDYEFNESGTTASGQVGPINSGTEGTRMSFDGDRPTALKGDEYVTNEVTGAISIRVPTRPWRNVSTWPEAATFVMYGTMVKDGNRYQVVFGSSSYGNYNTIFLATGDVSNNEVVLCMANGNAAGHGEGTVTKLCTMTVPNATTANHLYAFTLKTVGGNTVIDIYLDGELLQEYPFTGAFELGPGFQIASPHGGPVTGYARPAEDDPATLDFLRVYDTELSEAAIEKYAVEYPYVSPNGSYRREVLSDDAWVSPRTWVQEGTETIVDAPAAGSTVKLAVGESATLGVNLDANVTYEALIVNGSDLTIARAAGEQQGKVVSTGRVTANANVAFRYDAFSMANAPLTVKAGKTVTFDLSMIDMTQFFATRTYDLTGWTTLEDAASITFTAPAELYGRTITAGIDPTTKHYIVTVTAEERPFVYEGAGVWTWGTQPVSADVVSNNTDLAIVVQSDLEWPMDRAAFTVEGGTLKALAAPTAACAVTVGEGAAFDLNGKGATGYAIALAGGELANTAAEGKAFVTGLTVTADSSVNATGSISVQSSSSGWDPTTVTLGANTLVKTGAGDFTLVATTITGAGTLDIRSGKVYSSESTVFTDGTIKIGSGAMYQQRGARSTTVAKIIGDEGAQLRNNSDDSGSGTIGAFTLEGTLALVGGGNFGTITLAEDAALDVGAKRGLTLAGAGAVTVALTQEEFDRIAAGTPLAVFAPAAGATTAIRTVTCGGHACRFAAEGGTISSVAIPMHTIFFIK